MKDSSFLTEMSYRYNILKCNKKSTEVSLRLMHVIFLIRQVYAYPTEAKVYENSPLHYVHITGLINIFTLMQCICNPYDITHLSNTNY